jgi:hypothetical protein
MELKKYVRLEDKRIIDTTKYKAELNTFMGNMTERVLINTIWYEPEATSDNILDLAEEGDLVNFCGSVYELLFDDYDELYFYDQDKLFLLEFEAKHISFLYKKVGNNYIGYEVN